MHLIHSQPYVIPPDRYALQKKTPLNHNKTNSHKNSESHRLQKRKRCPGFHIQARLWEPGHLFHGFSLEISRVIFLLFFAVFFFKSPRLRPTFSFYLSPNTFQNRKVWLLICFWVIRRCHSCVQGDKSKVRKLS